MNSDANELEIGQLFASGALHDRQPNFSTMLLTGLQGRTQKYKRGVSKLESGSFLINIHDIHTSTHGLHRTLVEY